MASHADDRGDGAASLAHAVNLGDPHVEISLCCCHGQYVSSQDRVLAADTDEQDGTGAFKLYLLAGKLDRGALGRCCCVRHSYSPHIFFLPLLAQWPRSFPVDANMG